MVSHTPAPCYQMRVFSGVLVIAIGLCIVEMAPKLLLVDVQEGK